jgi:hypothetical protein
MSALSAPCPKCRVEMIYVTALPHPKASGMQKATFVCYGCNQTRSYVLSIDMAKLYAASHGNAELMAFSAEASLQ